MTAHIDPRTTLRQDGFPAQEQEQPGLTADTTPTPDHGESTDRGSGRLEGRRALITWGDSGTGRAVAIAFARKGADGKETAVNLIVAAGVGPHDLDHVFAECPWLDDVRNSSRALKSLISRASSGVLKRREARVRTPISDVRGRVDAPIVVNS